MLAKFIDNHTFVNHNSAKGNQVSGAITRRKSIINSSTKIKNLLQDSAMEQ